MEAGQGGNVRSHIAAVQGRKRLQAAAVIARHREMAEIREEQGENWVDKSGGNDIIRLSDINIGTHIKTNMYDQDVVLYDITDERINSIKPLSLSSLSRVANSRLTSECMKLLEYVRNDDTGTEAAFVFDSKMNEKKEFKLPDANGHVSFTCKTDKSVVIHNHPDGLLFSEADWLKFKNEDKIVILGAVGNNGSKC